MSLSVQRMQARLECQALLMSLSVLPTPDQLSKIIQAYHGHFPGQPQAFYLIVCEEKVFALLPRREDGIEYVPPSTFHMFHPSKAQGVRLYILKNEFRNLSTLIKAGVKI